MNFFMMDKEHLNFSLSFTYKTKKAKARFSWDLKCTASNNAGLS